jgi:hypothetical protein
MSPLSRICGSHRRWDNRCVFNQPGWILGLSFSIVLVIQCLELVIIWRPVMKTADWWVGFIILLWIFWYKLRLTVSFVRKAIPSAVFRNTAAAKPTNVLLRLTIVIYILFFWLNICRNATQRTMMVAIL